ncbi:unnamed protein product [Chilo suppressalis]|uniref:Large ribosomal subunit protein mL52 n=1 Tax=Chilo suppressalis TaxID=168631 RepID=A0ABN8ASU4_CHISP|nr:hypothetical protein evm_006505 [Chilo suppressalis]CAH0398897.1 unnamed protein product [Chilo suppressalis]
MSLLLNGTLFKQGNFLCRAFSCSSLVYTKQWRISKGLAVNRNAEGFILDGPDYTFLDGRPTPLLNKQKLRMLKQREFASKIIELSSEIDFAKELYQQKLKSAEKEKQRILDDRLKPKGKALLK